MEGHYIVFLLSCLGVINGFILAGYFAYISHPKKRHNQFLALLLLMLCFRIGKSIIYYFNVENPYLPYYIEIGLSACALIGPCLYFFVLYYVKRHPKTYAWTQLISYLVIILSISTFYPYFEYKSLWQKTIIPLINVQWLIYLLVAFRIIYKSSYFKNKNKEIRIDRKTWLLSIWGGVFLVWVSYNTVYFLPYILGAVTFSFVVYLMALLLIMGFRRSIILNPGVTSVRNNKMEDNAYMKLLTALDQLYTQMDLNIQDVANAIEVPKHELSQLLNKKYNMSFPQLLKSFRIEKVKKQLLSNQSYTIEAIGKECGFKAKSSFFTAFKQETGMTPRQYQKQLSLETSSDLQN